MFNPNINVKTSRKSRKSISSYLYKNEDNDLNLKEWFQEAIDRGYITASGGGSFLGTVSTDATLTGDGTSGSPLSVVAGAAGGIYGGSDSLTGSTTVTMGTNDLVFDGSGGGFTSITGVLASARTTNIATGENLLGFGVKGTIIDVLNGAQLLDSMLTLGDLTPLGLVTYVDGFLLGIADLGNNKGSVNTRGSVDASTGASEGNFSVTVQAGKTGNADIQMSAINNGSGTTNAIVGASGDDVPRVTLDSNALGAGNASEVYIQARNTTDGTSRAVVLDSLTGVTFYDAVGVQVFQIPWDFGDTSYADDTAAGVGGVAAGQWYLRTTGEIAQKL